jgi:hypoxanthine phosphoribosyltransferase
LHPEIECKQHGMHHRFGVICVDVQDWRKRYFRDIRAISRGTRIEVIRGKTNLIVDDQVDGSSGFIAVELRHLDDLIDNALSGDGGITVHGNR